MNYEVNKFDIIGDVHGCFDELILLFEKLGYSVKNNGTNYQVIPPKDRIPIFLGDIVDRGPKIKDVLQLIIEMVESGRALCILGNHEEKLRRKLMGRNVQVKNGLEDTLRQLEGVDQTFLSKIKRFLDTLPSHYFWKEKKLVLAHAGMKEELQGIEGKKTVNFALYGERTGKNDEFGLPIRGDWVKDYRGQALVIYGLTPQAEVLKSNNTINIDTGCVFGGKLTAYRYPEGEVVAVKALKTYSEPKKPIFDEFRSKPTS